MLRTQVSYVGVPFLCDDHHSIEVYHLPFVAAASKGGSTESLSVRPTRT